jgi:hypothetical protein
VQQGANESIMRCRLEQLENVLVAITLIDPPVVTIAMSGSIRQLRRRRQSSILAQRRVTWPRRPKEDGSIV